MYAPASLSVGSLPIRINKTELAALRTSWRRKKEKNARAGLDSGEVQAADSAVSCLRTFSVFFEVNIATVVLHLFLSVARSFCLVRLGSVLGSRCGYSVEEELC